MTTFQKSNITFEMIIIVNIKFSASESSGCLPASPVPQNREYANLNMQTQHGKARAGN